MAVNMPKTNHICKNPYVIIIHVASTWVTPQSATWGDSPEAPVGQQIVVNLKI